MRCRGSGEVWRLRAGKNGRQKKLVVDIDGDGSFLMNCQELATAAVEGLETLSLIHI